MKKSGSRAFAKTLKNLKLKGAWAVRPNGNVLFIEKHQHTSPRGSFVAHRSIKTVTKK
jgi:hypothetical protein